MRRTNGLFLICLGLLLAGCHNDVDEGLVCGDTVCQPNEVCINGHCVGVELCGDTVCKSDEICVEGQCVTALACTNGLSICNQACVNYQTDVKNCGSCGNTCAENMVCNKGNCELSCSPETTVCNGGCVDLKQDSANCGECGNKCADDLECKDGSCVIKCADSETICGDQCIDLQNDDYHCGSCDISCIEDAEYGEDGSIIKAGKNYICVHGKCESRCSNLQLECDGSCVNPLTDPNNCGACGNACKVGQACNQGSCSLRCGPGLTKCDNVCADLTKDHDHCGTCDNACKVGYSCISGECISNCPENQTECNGECFDLSATFIHCGACGVSCLEGQVCKVGQCKSDCEDDTLLNCEGNCIDPNTDNRYCGARNACGVGDRGAVCSNGFVCVEGACTCQEPGTACLSGVDEETGASVMACVDAQKDVHYCGCTEASQGMDCASLPNVAETSTCVDGKCSIVCNPGFEDCDHDLSNGCEANLKSPETCGACDKVCSSEHASDILCHMGECVPVCDDDYVACKGKCIPLEEADDSCGAFCGNGQLDPGELCDGNHLNCETCKTIVGKDYKGTLKCNKRCNGYDITKCVEMEDDDRCIIENRDCSSASDYHQSLELEDEVDPAAALDLAKAMDICMDVVSESSQKPGIIEYYVVQSNSENDKVFSRQINIKESMRDKDGNVKIAPHTGKTFILMSSGHAEDVYGGVSMDDDGFGSRGVIPETYLSKHEFLQSHEACSASSTEIYDSVRIHLKLRAPKTAKGFQFDFRFLSREYPAYVCSEFNDFFLALLTDADGNPIVDTNEDGSLEDEDGNICRDALGNLISVSNAIFTTCAAPPCDAGIFSSPLVDGCPGSLTCVQDHCGTCEDGYDVLSAYYPYPYNGLSEEEMSEEGKEDEAYYGERRGGGTAWLTTKSPIKPGEVFNLDFYLWDTSDSSYDSSVIIDNFQWLCTDTDNSTEIDCEKNEEGGK